ncbi:SUMO-activating enzyme subunit 2 [Hydra vulgaris]|uniref:SUMO-activating enzyme subunit n=1 Tax=Hydra vulgaris TaxID=6087 RepID=A0ABM4B5S4_HYDVU
MAGNSDLQKTASTANLLMVGAGGIGCELLKNLVLSGFTNIHIIDLDTIDVSNLNRQFLFQRKHVGKSKACIAKESVLSLKPNLNITALHDTIISSEYNVDFFQKFDFVLNALDNKIARNHVNRMCLAADVPLIESGSAGYLGQVTLIKKGFTECYECQPKPSNKTYPGCTIRNTPSEPVHCIVWAKHLFNQLFGEYDEEAEVSPDTADPELSGEAGEQALVCDDVTAARVSTREWAKGIDFNPEKLFTKFFFNDIKYLLSMEKLWQKRQPPTPLSWSSIEMEEEKTQSYNVLLDKRIWSIYECRKIFQECVEKLRERCKTVSELVWDKDDVVSMDFVAAAANIRSFIFHIPVKSRFDIKAISGNIIPAVASTNAIIAGLMVIEVLKLLSGRLYDCRTIFLNKQVKVKKQLLVPCLLEAPNPKCYICAKKPEVTIFLNLQTVTVKQLEDKILKDKLCMVAPDVEIDDGKGTILISSEEGETEENWDKVLLDFKISDGTRLKCDDFLQNFEIAITLRDKKDINADQLFFLEGEIPVPKDEKSEDRTLENGSGAKKRKLSLEVENNSAIKKSKVELEIDSDVVIL